MLTAKTEEADRVIGLEMGADDYLTKPFGMRELLARLRALIRRGQAQAPRHGASVIVVGQIEIDQRGRTVRHGGREVALKPKEFDLLSCMASDAGRVFTRQQLLEKVWGYDFFGGSRTVDVHIRWLREKLEDDPARPVHLLTIRGVGYKFVA
jgi:DNA-binding response OmpR family regulator